MPKTRTSKSCPPTPPGHFRGISYKSQEFTARMPKVHFSEAVIVYCIDSQLPMIQKLKDDSNKENEQKLESHESKERDEASAEEKDVDSDSERDSESYDEEDNENDVSDEYSQGSAEEQYSTEEYSESDEERPEEKEASSGSDYDSESYDEQDTENDEYSQGSAEEQYSANEYSESDEEIQGYKRYKPDLYKFTPLGNTAAQPLLPFPDYSAFKYEPFSHKSPIFDIFTKRSREENFSESEDNNLCFTTKRPNTSPELPIMQEKSAVAAFSLSFSSFGKRNRDKLSQEQNPGNDEFQCLASNHFKNASALSQNSATWVALSDDETEKARVQKLIASRASGIEPKGEWDSVDELCGALSNTHIDSDPHPTFTKLLGYTYSPATDG